MSILSDTKTTLENHRREGSLILNKDLIPFENIKAFLESLPDKQLLITVPSPDNISLSGQTFPQELILRGKIADPWNIKGIGDRLLNITQITLSSSQSNEAASVVTTLIIDGLLKLKAKQIPVQGRLIEGNRLKFNLTNSITTNFSLSEIADYATHSAMVEYLPTGVDIFNNVIIASLDLDFSFDSSVPTLFSITCNPSVSEWSIINDFTSLKNLGVVISSKYSPWNQDQLNLSFGGNIHGTLHIGHDYNIIIYFQGRNFWELTLIPANGNILPGLSELAELAGGDNLKTTVQNGLNAIGLGEISIQGVSIGFDLQSKKLSYISMSSQIAVAGVKVNLFTRLPNFEFAGSKSQDSSISLKTLIQHYFIQAEDFPELDITELSLTAYPSESLYSIHTIIQDVWDFKIASSSIAIAELELELTKSGNSISGSITASLMVVDVSVFIIAKSPENRGNGWQFEGKTATGNEIHLGRLINELATKFGTDTTLPSSVSDLIIENLGLSFNTKTKDFTFTCESKFPINNQEVDITVNINITQQLDGSYKKHFDGHITIGSLKFALIFDTDQTSTKFLAAYHDDQTVKVKDLIGYIDSQLKEDIPEGLEIRLKDALFAYSKQQTLTNFLFGLNIDGGINLSNLPLVGQEFPKEQTIGVDDLQFLIANKDFTSSEITTFNNLIEQGTKIPIKDSTANAYGAAEQIALPKGLNVAAKMQFGSQTNILALPISSSTPQTPTPSQPTVIPSTTTPPSDNATWFKIQKSFGPVHFERVGVQYKDAAIGFLLDASLNLAGLSLSLDGLAVNSPLNQFDPKFDLKGIGIDYKGSDTLEIGGAFLRTTRNGIDEYNGAAVIKFNVKAKTLNLSAIGSYAYFQGHPSLFIYAILDYPIGGPSFFFVTGLAAGFGYNRALKVPTIDQVATFPLVAEAVNPPPAEGSNSDQAARLTGELTKLRDYIPPETGQIFLAIGIKFTSFKLIDSFLLLTVAFGNRFELNLLGLATLIAPPNVGAGVPPVAQVQLAIKASFLPAEGFIGVIAQLTPNSYILSQACHLTGGFAFYGWFAPNVHEGDFVLTLGGYHPLFKVPDHYPKVPRLILNWQVNSELYIKADAYFALTPSAIMAGGHLQATWNSGPLSAWFNAGADFLMSWKPYHYDISIYIDMGVSYTFHFFGTHHITVQLGADLHIWGPEFTGIAHIHLWIISFDVSFGSSASQAPKAIDWNEFKTSFLPAADAICSITVQEGLVRKVNQDDKTDLGIINPKDFCLVTNSVIPIKTCNVNLNTQEINTQFGIGPMAVTPGQLTSTLTISVTRDGKSLSSAEFDEDFACSPLFKKVPVALWGESLTPSLNGNQFIENTLSGLEIKPKKQPEPGATQAINRSELQFSTTPINNAYHWQTIGTFQEETTKNIRNTIVDNAVNNTRDNLLKALNLKSEEIDLSATIADNLLGSPKIGVLVN